MRAAKLGGGEGLGLVVRRGIRADYVIMSRGLSHKLRSQDAAGRRRPAHMAQVGERALVRAVGWSTVDDWHPSIVIRSQGDKGPPPRTVNVLAPAILQRPALATSTLRAHSSVCIAAL